MKAGIVIGVFLSVLMVSGCVSSKKYGALVAENNELKGKIADIEEALKSAGEEKNRLMGELSGLKKAYEELSLRERSATEETAALRELLSAKKDELTNEIISLREKVSGLEAIKKALDESLKESEDMKNRYAEKINALASEIDTLKAELADGRMKIASLEAEVEKVKVEKEKALKEKEKELAELNVTYQDLTKELESEIKKGEIKITRLQNRLSVNMVEKILFDSGSAEIKKDGLKVLSRVGEILKKVKNRQIKVEGHTDNVPIGYRIAHKFPTNWELSTARATTVVRYLEDKAGIDPLLLAAAGYSKYRPVESNETEEGRALNRRIEIVLIPLDVDGLANPPH